MTDDLEEAEDERAIELSSIAAIYPELQIDPADPFTATIDIAIDLNEPLPVLFPSLANSQAPSGLPTPPASEDRSEGSCEQHENRDRKEVATDATHEVHELSHLPPVTLHIRLPPGYPDVKPPKLDIVTETRWLPSDALQRLKQDGSRLWEEMGHSQVVYAYIDHIREAAEGGFGVSTQKKGLSVSSDLKVVLLDYDLKAKAARFDRATFECGVCLDPKKGAVCHRLSLCGHVFCVECLQDFYNNCIKEGDVGNVKCIAPKCGQSQDTRQKASGQRKRDKTIGPSELLQIPLAQEVVQRYVDLKRKKALESDRMTVYCPRQWCQGPARSKKTEALDRNLELESDDENPVQPDTAPTSNDDSLGHISPGERLAVCTDCTFAFCKICKAGWHGEFLICDPKRKGELNEEEKASEEYIKLHTSSCPTCNAKCQKTHGCNHMICFKCSTHFCYLCTSWLDASNPYQHFNNPQKPCFLRLWELEAGDGDDVDRGFAGGRIEENGVAPNGFWQEREDPNPIADLDDVDSDEDLIEPPHMPFVPPPEPLPRRIRNRRARHLAVPPPAPRIQAAIARRAGGAPLQEQGHDPGIGRAQEAEAQIHQPEIVRAPLRRPPAVGMQRFLELVRNDEEDEWDSDELGDESEDDDDFWEIPFR
ncbi:MAG: hypothetical protein Q9220_006915 [cf. Caloplaca sp. 1 TL-2023]